MEEMNSKEAAQFASPIVGGAIEQLRTTSETINLRAIQVEIEKEAISWALGHTGGIKARACKLLGLERSTMIEKMRKHGMQLNSPSVRRVQAAADSAVCAET